MKLPSLKSLAPFALLSGIMLAGGATFALDEPRIKSLTDDHVKACWAISRYTTFTSNRLHLLDVYENRNEHNKLVHLTFKVITPKGIATYNTTSCRYRPDTDEPVVSQLTLNGTHYGVRELALLRHLVSL